MSRSIQKFTIQAADPKELVRAILEFGKRGAWLPDDEYPQLNHYPKHVKLAIAIEDGQEPIESGPNVIALGAVLDVTSYTKDELLAMEWEQLKAVCREVGITGRDKAVMVSKYLSISGNEEVKPKRSTSKSASKSESKPNKDKPVEEVKEVTEVKAEVEGEVKE